MSLVNLDNALDYLEFVEERHRIWERRQAGEPQPWTEHPILAARKFTNVYRVLDYGSQFLLKELLEPDLSQRDTLMRCFLYRHTGRPEMWGSFKAEYGEYPHLYQLELAYDYWSRLRDAGNPVFTGAYLVYPQSATPGTDKLRSIINLTDRLFGGYGETDILSDFLKSRMQATRFGVLRRNRGVADFMSMQVLTDWNYSQYGADVEDEFVVLGPGAVRGAKALHPGSDTMATLLRARDMIYSSPDCPQLYGRRPSLMDIQNTLCEFSKFVRYRDKPLTTTPYPPAHPGPQPLPVLPAVWGLETRPIERSTP